MILQCFMICLKSSLFVKMSRPWSIYEIWKICYELDLETKDPCFFPGILKTTAHVSLSANPP